MTDITELAQILKAAAIDAKELAIIARYSKGRAAAEKFYALANPNNVIALVEALEKAQQRITQLESRTVTINTPDARDEDYDWDGQTPSEAFNTCRMICALMFRQSLRAVGIKVEAE
ncbi:hypothetical protein J0X08_00339 [Klebsiella variicola]|uniref:hypothetical protein n=1 Tax=Klebsiella variicola TaxID=244366 RepID=UPI001BAB79BC|nr:hypothetical protein [Klebsiella variicola]MBR8846292.1 hypothetical protein [Klebsiella variicola]